MTLPRMEELLDRPLRDTIAALQERAMTQTTWSGIQAIKWPCDYWSYQEIITRLRPAVIIEVGNWCGGSTLALAHLQRTCGGGGVVFGVDVDHSRLHQNTRACPGIYWVTGDAADPKVITWVRKRLPENGHVLVIEDSSHERDQCLAVLHAYADLVTPGSYLIVEDSICGHGLPCPWPGPSDAIADFLASRPDFTADREVEWPITWNPGGFLRRT